MKIIFIGASGMLGRPVAEELIRTGFEVSLLARDTDKLQKLFPSCKVIEGDVFNKNDLANAFADHDCVYLNLSINKNKGNSSPQPEREGIANVIAAAKETGIKRISYLSSIIKNYQGMNGFKWWAFEIKQKAVERIKSSGIAYSIFYPSTFFETLNKDMIRGNKMILPNGSVMPMWFIGAHDYGKQVAKALRIAGNGNQEYVIQGQEAYTFEEAAKVFIDHYKTKLKLLKIPSSPLKIFSVFSHKMSYAWHILTALYKYPEKFESERTWQELGKPTTTLANYAAGL